MVIDQNYILNRIAILIAEKQAELHKSYESQKSILKFKYGIPAWLRKLIFNPLNPAFAIKKQYDESKGNKIIVPPLHRFAIDFMSYVKNNASLHFDCSKYYDDESFSAIIDFIDNKIRSVFAGFSKIPINSKQKTYKQKIEQYRDKVKKINNDCFMLQHNSNKYYLSVNSFFPYIFDHHYGLKDLPEPLKKYISNKVFLDIGAYCGDSSLIFSHYNPLHIYAYEPESKNFMLLKKTIAKNKLEKVTPIKKGLGDEVAKMSIRGDGISASLIESAQNKETKNETVEISTIDIECSDKNVGLIKMDVEGFEYFVVKGGQNTIKRDKPLLLISLYHTGRDFFEIPPMIKDVCPEYKFKFYDLAPSDIICEKILIAYI